MYCFFSPLESLCRLVKHTCSSSFIHSLIFFAHLFLLRGRRAGACPSMHWMESKTRSVKKQVILNTRRVQFYALELIPRNKHMPYCIRQNIMLFLCQPADAHLMQLDSLRMWICIPKLKIKQHSDVNLI